MALALALKASRLSQSLFMRSNAAARDLRLAGLMSCGVERLMSYLHANLTCIPPSHLCLWSHP